MNDRPLDEWLAHLETLHPAEIELGLERVAVVARRLLPSAFAARVITVGGTNGKGSICGMLEAVLQARGDRVCLYTSPHLWRFSERIRVDGRDCSDHALAAALVRVENAREGVPLTFFEYTTLAALDVFHRAEADYIVLEVGLGGRLDATNVVDSDVAVVSTVGIDHAEWLGVDRDAIGAEKAGICRENRPLIYGEPEPPEGLVAAVEKIGADLVLAGRDFGAGPALRGDGWDWWGQGESLHDLPQPALAGGYQRANAATALAALQATPEGLPAREAVVEGLRRVRIPGRFQIVAGAVETILDVAHNPQAAAALAAALATRECPGRTRMAIGMYADKDAIGVVEMLAPIVDDWYCASLPPPRGRTAEVLGDLVRAVSRAPVDCHPDPVGAWMAARAAAQPGDRIVVAGSFATVAQVTNHSL